MLISQLLKAIDIVYKEKDADIKLITDDSRKCEKGSIFICTEKGGHYVAEALSRGAELVIAESEVCDGCIVVENSRRTFAVLSQYFWNNCHKNLRIIGVTGTNGKTTTCEMLHRIFTLSGKKCGLVSTVRNISVEESESDCTTDDPFMIHKIFYELYSKGILYCIVECSSQGLEQERLYGIDFDIAVLTNVSSDHLDYHKTRENYIGAKKKLFKQSRSAVINLDDECADEFIAASRGKVITYSLKKDEADFTAKCINAEESVSNYAFVGDSIIHRIRINTPGRFNISNSMAALAAAINSGIALEEAAAALRSFYGVRGRMELLALNEPFRVIIDYAHTPDSLKQVLLSLSDFKKGRVITVFGCGGNRDREKRPLMGKTVSDYSDIAIVTSDNPRNESPEDIIDGILEGTVNSKIPVYIQKNRTKAIEYALKIAEKDDIILLCGKGHEAYQIIGEEKIPYDEREIVSGLLKNREN